MREKHSKKKPNTFQGLFKVTKEGEEQGSKSPFSLLSEPISPSSLLFPPISPSSQIFLGYFSLLPILFLPPH